MDSNYSSAAAEDHTKTLERPNDGTTTLPHHSSTSTSTTGSDNPTMRHYHSSIITTTDSNTLSQQHNLPSIHDSAMSSSRTKDEPRAHSVTLPGTQQPSTGVIMGPAGLPLASTTKDMITGTTPTQRPSRAKKGKRVHDCVHPGCGKIFTRAEHLRRHQLNHSSDVVYKCEICEKKFVRQDLLSRHQERHATTKMQTVQSMPMGHRSHPHQYGAPMGYPAGASGEHILPLPSSDYIQAGPHSYENSGFRGVLPHNVDSTTPFGHYSNTSSPHPSSVISSPAASVTSLQTSTYPSQSHPGEPHLDFSNIARTPSPGSSRRVHHGNLQYHMAPKDAARRHEPYMVSQSEIQRGSQVTISGPPNYQPVQPVQVQHSPLENYGWLLDEQQQQQSGKGLGIEHLSAVAEQTRFSYSPPPDCSAANPTMVNRGFFVFQHPIDDKARHNVLGIINNPTFASRDVGSMQAMQGYLLSYWKNFHGSFPILHRPTFVPSEQLSCLIAMVVAVGASYSDDQGARNFAMTIFERVRDYVLTGEFQSVLPSNLQFQQTLLLTDIFGKLRTTQQTFTSDVRIDNILADCVRRIDPNTPRPSSIHHRFQELGLPLDMESEWRRWIEVESSRKLATFYLLWDVQQGIMFDKPLAWHSHKFETPTISKHEENLWNCETTIEWQNYLQMVPPQHMLLSLLQDCLNLEPQVALRPMSPYEITFVLHGLARTDISRMNSPDASAKKDRMTRAILKWRHHFTTYIDGQLPGPCAERVESVYTLTQITRNIDIRILRTVAGDPRTFQPNARHIEDFYQSKQDIQNWAGSMEGQISTWHAVRFINRILSQGRVGCYDHSVAPWALYVCALVCWAYGSYPGRTVYSGDGKAMWEPENLTRDYLSTMLSPAWNALPTVQVPPVNGLLVMIQQVLGREPWGLAVCSAGVLGGLLQAGN